LNDGVGSSQLFETEKAQGNLAKSTGKAEKDGVATCNLGDKHSLH